MNIIFPLPIKSLWVGYMMTIATAWSCDQSNKFPDAYKGNWKTSIPIEGTDDSLYLTISIEYNQLVVRQQFPRMSGVDKISTTYVADRTKINDDELIVYSKSNSTNYLITLQLLSDSTLNYKYCQSDETPRTDAEFSMCNDWVVLSSEF